MNTLQDDQAISKLADQINLRLSTLQQSVDLLLSQRSTKPPDPHFLSWAQASLLFGATSPGAIKKRILRENRKPDGLRIRTRRGGVNKCDFKLFMEKCEARQTRRDYATGAVESMTGSEWL